MFCNKCGTQLPDGTKFCKNCGAPQPAVPQAQPNYGPPQGYQQPGYGMPPQPQFSAPQPQYSAPQGHQQTQYAARPAGNAQNAAKLILMIAVLMTVGMLIACIFKGTIFNVESKYYGISRNSSPKSFVRPITMDNHYFAIIKDEGFGYFSDHLEEKGMESATTYIALTAAAAMAVLVLIAAVLALIGKHSSAGKTAGIAAFISAVPHGMYIVLTLFLQSKDDEYRDVKLSMMPVGMIAAGVLIGAFCIAAAKSMNNTASAPAGKAWR